MDSLKSMKNGMMHIDPFMRTNQALLKRLDSISTLFNKEGGGNNAKAALQENNNNIKTNFPGYVSQTSNRFGVRDTPMFKIEGVSEIDASDRDARKSAAFGAWETNRGSGVMVPNGQSPKKKISQSFNHAGLNPKDTIQKSEKSVVSVNEILEFEDYVPFRPAYNLEQIDEEKQVGLDKDLEERKSVIHERKRKRTDITLTEARMSEEESFTSHDKTENYEVVEVSEPSEDDESIESIESSEDQSELKDCLRVNVTSKPRKSSTFNSSQLNDRKMLFPTKLSSQYNRQGTGNSELTMGNYSQKGGILTSI